MLHVISRPADCSDDPSVTPVTLRKFVHVLWSQEIYDRLEELDPSSFETDAIKLLTGLGFGPKMMAKATKVRSFLCQCMFSFALYLMVSSMEAVALLPAMFASAD